MPTWSGLARVRPRLAGFLGSAMMLLVPTACSDSSNDPGEVLDVNSYFLNLPSWAEFSPERPPVDQIAGPSAGSVERVEGIAYECLTTPYSITATPDRIVTLDPDVNVLWLGALLQGDGYRDGIGSLQEWAIRERAPLTISIDLLAGDNTRTVQQPDLASVTQAIGQLVSAAEASGHSGGSSVAYDQETTHSVQQGLLSLGVSAGYASVSVKASLSAQRSAAERTVTAYFVQRMFTVSVVLPSEPAAFFSTQFTRQRLQEEVNRGNVGPNSLPVYVANIVYGRILMFSLTSTANLTDIKASIAASFSSIAGGHISARYQDILNSATISVVALGGDGQNAAALIQSGQLKDYFTSSPALTTARPISYTVRNLGDNSIAKVSETTEYNLKECTAIPATGSMTVDVTPNDASVFVSGPNNFTFGPSTGDLTLEDLAPGGYTLTVTRQDFDTLSVDTTVVVGQATNVTAALTPAGGGGTGGIYRVQLRRLVAENVSCSGEGEADLYYSVRANGQVVQSVGAGNSIPISSGQWITLTGATEQTVREQLVLSLDALDADGALSADDPMGSGSVTWTFPNIPTGPNQTLIVENVSGCRLRLEFEVTKLGPVFNARAGA